MAIVHAIVPKGCSLKPGRERWILKDDANALTTFFGGEVNPSAQCRKIYGMLRSLEL
jgi:hypothetical protein